MKNLIISAVVSIISLSAFAQAKYKPVDDRVAQMGAMTDKNVAEIADRITASFTDKEQKSRAIYYWIANNISIDPKRSRSNDKKNTLPEDVIRLRQTTSLGFANLFQEMASQAGIRCLVVDGYVKRNWQDIGEALDEPNYSWNVVQLGQSPEQWYYVDAASGAGSVDEKFTTFTPNFISEFFFADKEIYNLSHFADNAAWSLGIAAKSKKEFINYPLFSNSAVAYGIKKPTPPGGFTKAKINKEVSFSFPYNGKEVKSVSVSTGNGKKAAISPVDQFSADGSTVSFNYTFKKDESFPFKILVNDAIVIEYNMEVTE